MKIIRKASGKKVIKMSKAEWQGIGRKAGWLNKKAEPTQPAQQGQQPAQQGQQPAQQGQQPAQQPAQQGQQGKKGMPARQFNSLLQSPNVSDSTIKQEIEQGAEVDDHTFFSGIMSGKLNILQMVVNHLNKLKVPLGIGSSTLSRGIAYINWRDGGGLEFVQELVKLGAKPDNDTLTNAMNYSAASRDYSVIQYVISLGANNINYDELNTKMDSKIKSWVYGLINKGN